MGEKPLSASELRKRGFDRAADALERKQIEEYYLYDLRLASPERLEKR